MTLSRTHSYCFEPAEYEKPAKVRFIQIDAPLANLPKSFFDDVGHVEELVILPVDCARNVGPIEERIPDGFFSGFRSLRVLRIFGRNIPVINSRGFLDLEKLSVLELRGGTIRRIEHGAFRTLSDLSLLSLSHNKLTMLCGHEFLGLTNLTRLDVSGNSIRELAPKVFQWTPRIISLNLCHNRLRRISPEVFSGVKRINAIGLTGNPVSSLCAATARALGNNVVIL